MYHQQANHGKLAQRRPVTSCLECYRRKQKCNRRQPCNQCRARKVPEKCIFSNNAGWPDSISLKQNATTTSRNNEAARDGISGLANIQAPSVPTDHYAYVTAPTNEANRTALRSKHDIDRTLPSLPTNPSSSHSTHADVYSGLLEHLPPPDTVQMLLKFFFVELYWGAMTIDENHFQNLYDNWQKISTSHHCSGPEGGFTLEMRCFPALLFQVLAQSLHAISPQHTALHGLGIHDQEGCDGLSEAYHANGNQIVHMLGRHNPSVCSIEHDILAFCWLKNSGRFPEAWYQLGSAIRQAQEMGMHRLPQYVHQAQENSIELNLMNIWELEHRKRLWVRLFILDSSVALVLGKPRFLHREDCLISQPLDCEYPKDPTRTIPVSKDTSPYSRTTLSLTLAHKAHDVLSLSGSGVLSGDYAKVMRLHEDICGFRDQLISSWRTGSEDSSTNKGMYGVDLKRLLTLKQVDMILIALHRPFVRSQSSSRMAAVSAALRHLDIQQSIFELVPYLQRRLFENPFYTVDISIFLSGVNTEITPADALEQQRIRNAIFQAVRRISDTKELRPVAVSGEQMLRQIRQKFPQDVDWSQPQDWPFKLWLEDTHMPDTSIPVFQKPLHETFSVLVEEEQAAYGHLLNFQDTPLPTAGNPVLHDADSRPHSFQDFNYDDYLWPLDNNI